MDIVDIAVVVVIDTVIWNFPGIDPKVGLDILMRRIQAVIDNTDHDGVFSRGGSSRGNIPGQVHLQIDAWSTSRLAGVEQVPLGREAGIVGKAGAQLEQVVDQAVHLGVLADLAQEGIFVYLLRRDKAPSLSG
ncbi:MAG: hypothetical protein IPK21_00645 [Haliscomenobacter sp.]|nr:hypothetical protein [Haliscomenobacter sp.]